MGRTAAAFVIAAALCAGCSSSGDARDHAAPASPITTGSSTRPSEPSRAPATESGPLSIDSFPTPRQLGPGWSYRVDPGGHDDGHLGNGTPGLERDPDEVAALAVPLGCPRTSPMPRPTRAFEVDYAYDGRPVVAVRLEFPRPGQAAAFRAGRERNLRSCVGRSGGPAVGPYVATVRGRLNDRTPESEPWTELVLRQGSGVLLMAAPAALGRPPFTRGAMRRIDRWVEGG